MNPRPERETSFTITPNRRSRRRRGTGRPAPLALVCLTTTALLLPAAASAALTPEVRDQLTAGGFDPLEIEEPLRLEEDMKKWASRAVPGGTPQKDRLKKLLRLLHESSTFDFKYQEGYTATVAETYRTGRYNCLSFSMLFVELARSLDLPASFLSIKRDHSFRRDGDLVVLTRHITAGYGNFADRTVLEFDVGPEVDYAAAEPISDTEALALYYSNRGAELLRGEKLDEAAEKLEIAILLAPDIAQSWVNLGVAYRRQGQFDKARHAYEKAATLERDNIAAYQNLVILLRRNGDRDTASQLIELLDGQGNRNPFTYLTLGDFSLEDGRLQEAGEFYKKAHRLARHEAETNAAVGLWAMLVGKTSRAKSWLRRAEKIDPTNLRVVRLGARLKVKEARARNCHSMGFPARGIAGSLRDVQLCEDPEPEETEEEFAASLSASEADS